MGQFSWKTNDTHKSIYCVEGYQSTVYMKDNQGNVWKEDNYQGYGVFGGKDFYNLLYDMNKGFPFIHEVSKKVLFQYPNKGKDEKDLQRLIGIELAFSNLPFISPCLFENKSSKWVNCAPPIDPNQGWLNDEDDYEDDYNF